MKSCICNSLSLKIQPYYWLKDFQDRLHVSLYHSKDLHDFYYKDYNVHLLYYIHQINHQIHEYEIHVFNQDLIHEPLLISLLGPLDLFNEKKQFHVLDSRLMDIKCKELTILDFIIQKYILYFR